MHHLLCRILLYLSDHLLMVTNLNLYYSICLNISKTTLLVTSEVISNFLASGSMQLPYLKTTFYSLSILFKIFIISFLLKELGDSDKLMKDILILKHFNLYLYIFVSIFIHSKSNLNLMFFLNPNSFIYF